MAFLNLPHNPDVLEVLDANWHMNYSKIHASSVFDPFIRDINTKIREIAGVMSAPSLLCSLSDNAKTASNIIEDSLVFRISLQRSK